MGDLYVNRRFSGGGAGGERYFIRKLEALGKCKEYNTKRNKFH